MNRATRDALRDFQRQENLPVDGIAGPETEKALIAARARGTSAAPSDRLSEDEFDIDLDVSQLELEDEVQRNSREYIRWVQRSLNKIMGSRLALDGLNGPMTRSAVRSFQRSQGLAVDGIVGPNTQRLLVMLGVSRPPGMASPAYSTSPARPSPAGTVDLVEIEPGKYVARQIATNLRDLLATARSAGLSLWIRSAYRSPNEQIALRRKNCGTSDFDLFERDPKQCSPVTAKPGTSNHEKGLAVDLDWETGGRAKSWSDPEARWLRRHAKTQFGLDNKISSEPWHWSVNGK